MQVLLQVLAIIMAIGLAVEGYRAYCPCPCHARRSNNEGAASYYQQVTEYGKSYILRNGLLALNLVLAAVIAMKDLSGLLVTC